MAILDLLKRIFDLLRGKRDVKGTASLRQRMAEFKRQLDEIQLDVQKSQHKLLQVYDLFERAKNDLADLAKEYGATHPKTLFATTNVQKLDDRVVAMRRHWQTLEDREKVVRQMIVALEIKIERDLPVSEEEIRQISDEAALVLNEHEQLMDTLDDSNRLIDTLAEQQDARFERVRQGALASYTDVEVAPEPKREPAQPEPPAREKAPDLE